MTERPVHHSHLPLTHALPQAPFPGATGLSVLDVYDWVAPDGLQAS